MPTIVPSNPTIADVTSMMLPDGSLDRNIIDIVAQKNEIFDALTFVEANGYLQNVTTNKTGDPAGTWRGYNTGAPPSVGKFAQLKDGLGMLEDYSNVDVALARNSGDEATFRLNEDRSLANGMMKTMASTLFYGDTAVNPKAFDGFSKRYSSLEAENGENILTGDGVGADNTSIWLVVNSPQATNMVFPKGSKAGIQIVNLGEHTHSDGQGGYYQVYRTHFKWDAGLVVRDWRQVVRIANIDVSNLTKNAATGSDIIDLMTQALEKVWDVSDGRAAFFVNRTVRGFLRRQIVNKTVASTLSWETVAGRKVVMFGEVPVYRCDALLNSEAAVV